MAGLHTFIQSWGRMAMLCLFSSSHDAERPSRTENWAKIRAGGLRQGMDMVPQRRAQGETAGSSGWWAQEVGDPSTLGVSRRGKE